MDKKALLEQFRAEVEASGTSVNHILKMCEFNEVSNDFSSDTIHDYSVGCLNGAWWMFQRQQAKVEELQNNINLLNEALDIKEQLNQKLREREDELQKRVGQQGLIIAKAMSIASDLQKSWSMFEIGKKLEQALKGEG